MFKHFETSDILRFINEFLRDDESKICREDYEAALNELRERSPLLALAYEV